MTLTELTGQWLELKDMMLDPEIDPQAIADTMEGLEGELEDKADGYAIIMDLIGANVALIRAEQERLRARRQTLENRIENMKQRLTNMMQVTGKRKFETATRSYRIQKNPPKLVIDHPEAIPARFLIEQEPKVDSKAIIQEIKAGVLIAWGHLEQGESLRIS